MTTKPTKKPRPTTWKPGQSGNPSGRPPMTDAERKAREMLKAASPLAVATLVKAMQAGGPDGVRAATAVLNKLWPTGIDLTVSAPGGGPVEVKRIDVRTLSREQIEVLLAVIRANAVP